MPYQYFESTKRRTYTEPKEYQKLVNLTVAAESSRDWPDYYRLQIEFLTVALTNDRVLPNDQARAMLTLKHLGNLARNIRKGNRNHVRPFLPYHPKPT